MIIDHLTNIHNSLEPLEFDGEKYFKIGYMFYLNISEAKRLSEWIKEVYDSEIERLTNSIKKGISI